MNIAIKQIPTDNPIIEQWQLLAQYTYEPNIERYFSDREVTLCSESDIEFIAGSIRQSEAYFNAAKSAPLDVSPLLMYYGTSNLLLATGTLLKGERPNVYNHGMKLDSPDGNEPYPIGDIQINTIDPSTGALRYLSTIFSSGDSIANGETWTLSEILGSIPELKQDFEACYSNKPPYVIPVEIVKKRKKPYDRIRTSELVRFNDISELVSFIPNYSSSYHRPLWSENDEFVTLYRKLDSEEIGFVSTYGQKYLEVAHKKNGRLMVASQPLLYFMGLFALGTLNRYNPERWHPFVQSDTTGERLLVERFLRISQRVIPNLALNAIYDCRVSFVQHFSGVYDSTPKFSTDDLKDMMKQISDSEL